LDPIVIVPASGSGIQVVPVKPNYKAKRLSLVENLASWVFSPPKNDVLVTPAPVDFSARNTDALVARSGVDVVSIKSGVQITPINPAAGSGSGIQVVPVPKYPTAGNSDSLVARSGIDVVPIKSGVQVHPLAGSGSGIQVIPVPKYATAGNTDGLVAKRMHLDPAFVASPSYSFDSVENNADKSPDTVRAEPTEIPCSRVHPIYQVKARAVGGDAEGSC
jgi:hypothetical protein